MRLSVWPSLVPMTIAWSSPVLKILVALLTIVEPPVLPVTAMPPFSWVASASPVSVIGPLNVTVPPVRPVISAVLPGAVVDGAGVGDVAAAAVEVEGDAGGAGDRAAVPR